MVDGKMNNDRFYRVIAALALCLSVFNYLGAPSKHVDAGASFSSGGGAAIDPATTKISWNTDLAPEIQGSTAGPLNITSNTQDIVISESGAAANEVRLNVGSDAWEVDVEQRQTIALSLSSDIQARWTQSPGGFTAFEAGIAKSAAAVLDLTDGSTGAGAIGLREDTMLPAAQTNKVLLAAEDVGGRSRAFMIPDVGGNIHLGGRLNLNTTAVGTGAATTETNLQTYSLPANTLGTASGVRITAAGTAVGTLDVQTITLYFGATAIAKVSVPTASTKDWDFECLVLNDAAAGAQIVISRAFEDGVADETNTYRDGLVIDTALAVTIKTTGTTPNASDEVTSEILLVELIP